MIWNIGKFFNALFLTNHETAGRVRKVLPLRVHQSGLELFGGYLSGSVYVHA